MTTKPYAERIKRKKIESNLFVSVGRRSVLRSGRNESCENGDVHVFDASDGTRRFAIDEVWTCSHAREQMPSPFYVRLIFTRCTASRLRTVDRNVLYEKKPKRIKLEPTNTTAELTARRSARHLVAADRGTYVILCAGRCTDHRMNIRAARHSGPSNVCRLCFGCSRAFAGSVVFDDC